MVNRGVWVEVLEQMNYRRTLLIEVPPPDEQAQPELADAVRLLGEAQQHMLRGHDRDAVGSCRDVLEAARVAIGDTDDIPADLHEVLFAKSRSMSKSERLRVLRRALVLVTHPARHRDEVAARIQWGRTDAAAMVTMTAAFLNDLAANATPVPVGTSHSEGSPPAG